MPKKTLLVFLCLCASLLCASAAPKPYIVFVTGDHEYGSERSMPALARELENKFGFRTKVLYATRPDGTHDENYEQNIPGLEELKKADLAIFFLRWRQLPKEQVALIDDYLKSGKPLMGFRTTSHSFNYPPDNPLAKKWNAFGEIAFGTPPGWGAAGHTHYGHKSTTDVSIIESEKDSPLLKGVADHFHVPSWLYHVLPKYPAPGSTPVLMGTSVNPDKAAVPNPVAWTFKTQWGARSFYTSMGHPEDFAVEPFQRLVVNAVYWCLGKNGPSVWPGKLDINVSYEKPPKK